MHHPAKSMADRPAQPSSHLGGFAKNAGRKSSSDSRFSAPDRRSFRSRPPPGVHDSRCRSAAVVRGIEGAAGRPGRTVATMAARRTSAGTPVGSRPQTRLSRRGASSGFACGARSTARRRRSYAHCPSPRDSESEAGGDRTRANPAGHCVPPLLRDGFRRRASPPQNRQVRASSRARRLRRGPDTSPFADILSGGRLMSLPPIAPGTVAGSLRPSRCDGRPS